MRKRFVTTLILCLICAVCVSGAAGCSSGKNVDNKKYLLGDISLSFEDTVSEQVRTAYEEHTAHLLESAEAKAKIYCNFYNRSDSTGHFITNYNGSNMLCGMYKQEDGEIKIIDNSTSENISFKADNNSVVLTETKDGAKAEYVFDFYEKVTQYNRNSQVDLSGKTYGFVGISHIFVEDLSEKQINDYNSALSERRFELIASSISFGADGTFKANIDGESSSGTYVIQGNGSEASLTVTDGKILTRSFFIEGEDMVRFSDFVLGSGVNRAVYMMLAE